MQDIIQSYIDENLPFFAFKLPDERKVKIGLADEARSINFTELENISKNSFIIFPFDNNLSSGWAFSSKEENEITIEESDFYDEYKFDDSIDSFSLYEFNNYKLQFSEMMESFQKENVSKAILSKVIEVEKSASFSVVDMFKRLLNKYPSTYVFLFSTKETGMWMGASPELLFSRVGDRCKTVSLAGTRSPDDTIDKWTNKEKEEQGMVTSFIDDVLSKNHVVDYHKENIKLINVGSVSHLKTSYEFKITSETSWGNIIKELHPTPALCGEPKLKAMKLIQRVEPHNREFYGGFMGFIDKDINLYVNLRSMKIENKDLKIFVGGGLTKKSILEDEWNELKLKSQILLSIL